MWTRKKPRAYLDHRQNLNATRLTLQTPQNCLPVQLHLVHATQHENDIVADQCGIQSAENGKRRKEVDLKGGLVPRGLQQVAPCFSNTSQSGRFILF